MRDGERLRAAYADVDPGRVLLDTCDVTDHGALRATIERTVARFGRLDGVVANAGTGALGDILSVPTALPHLRESPHPSIVVMNGVTAHAPDLEMAAVSTARAALAALVVMLARRLSVEGSGSMPSILALW